MVTKNRREKLFRQLEKSAVLNDPLIRAAFSEIDRADFVREDYSSEAYEDYPLPIGEGQTISQPTTVAFMLEKLGARVGESVLDVGTGSGYTTALLSSIVGEKGRVSGVEIVESLVEFGNKNIAKYSFKNCSIERARDGVLGLPEKAPFDRILVSAAAEKLPRELVDQLKIGGIMVAVVGDSICRIEKTSNDAVSEQCWSGFAFVPLITLNYETL